MKGRSALAVVAWALLAAQVVMGVGGVALAVANGPMSNPFQTPWTAAALTAGLLSFPAVGAVLVARLPRNRIGWLFLTAPGGYVALLALEEYARYGLLRAPGSLPLADIAIWLSQWVWAPSAALLLTLTILLFPGGRPPSPAWWAVGWAAGLASAVAMVLLAVRSWRLRGLSLLAMVDGRQSPATSEVTKVGDALAFTAIVTGALALVSMVVRFRRSRGRERRQLTWFAWAGALLIVHFPLRAVVGEPAANFLFAFALAAIPVATGIAILRHRLYDIDRLVNRTIVYGLLTVLLGATYAALVTGVQALTEPLTSGSDLAVAGSTLVVAALFRPLRARVQRVVDRRFNRRRLDAARALQAYRDELRGELDLDHLREGLLAVTRRTMQPAVVSLWLRDRTP